MFEQFDALFELLNYFDEGKAVNYISYYWDDESNNWNRNLIDESAIKLIQRDIEFVYQDLVAIQD